MAESIGQKIDAILEDAGTARSKAAKIFSLTKSVPQGAIPRIQDHETNDLYVRIFGKSRIKNIHKRSDDLIGNPNRTSSFLTTTFTERVHPDPLYESFSSSLKNIVDLFRSLQRIGNVGRLPSDSTSREVVQNFNGIPPVTISWKEFSSRFVPVSEDGSEIPDQEQSFTDFQLIRDNSPGSSVSIEDILAVSYKFRAITPRQEFNYSSFCNILYSCVFSEAKIDPEGIEEGVEENLKLLVPELKRMWGIDREESPEGEEDPVPIYSNTFRTTCSIDNDGETRDLEVQYIIVLNESGVVMFPALLYVSAASNSACVISLTEDNPETRDFAIAYSTDQNLLDLSLPEIVYNSQSPIRVRDRFIEHHVSGISEFLSSANRIVAPGAEHISTIEEANTQAKLLGFLATKAMITELGLEQSQETESSVEQDSLETPE